MWLTKLKTALVLEETEHLASLIDEMPAFQSVEEMEEAFFLLQQVKTLIEEKKTESLQTMRQLKDTLEFLKSTQTFPTASLNLKF